MQVFCYIITVIKADKRVAANGQVQVCCNQRDCHCRYQSAPSGPGLWRWSNRNPIATCARFAPFVSEHCFAWYPYVRGYEACQRSSSSWAALADWGSGRVVSESQAQAARQIPLYEEALAGVNGIKCHLQGPKVIVRHRAM